MPSSLPPFLPRFFNWRTSVTKLTHCSGYSSGSEYKNIHCQPFMWSHFRITKMKTFIFITKKGNSGARQNYRNLKLTSHLAVQDTMAAWREGCMMRVIFQMQIFQSLLITHQLLGNHEHSAPVLACSSLKTTESPDLKLPHLYSSLTSTPFRQSSG